MQTGPQETAKQATRNTAIYTEPADKGEPGHVFITEHGSVGMEKHGRIVVKSIESWIAMAWGDLR